MALVTRPSCVCSRRVVGVSQSRVMLDVSPTDPPEPTRPEHGGTARPRWFGPSDRRRLAWWSLPTGRDIGPAALIVPPLGYEAWSAHRTLRTLAERLAAHGWTAVRYDPDATGDSAGGSWDAGRVAAWRDDISLAVADLRSAGATSITLIGLRWGATLALETAATVAADGVVAWAPVTQGRRLVRQLRLVTQAVPEDPSHPERTGALVSAGTVLRVDTLADLATIDLLHATRPPASEVLLVERDDQTGDDGLGEHLMQLGASVSRCRVPGTDRAVDRPTEYAEVPTEALDAIVDWMGPAPDPVGAMTGDDLDQSATAHRTTVDWPDGPVDEEVLSIGPDELVGVITRPPGPSRAVVVWLNSGSEHHVGPGRAWVEYARALAPDGFTSIRLDCTGWGESPDAGHAPGRPYDLHCVDECSRAVSAVAALELGPVVVAGLCAGAWIALRAALDVPPDGVIALNPQMYWQPGDPVEADIVAETRVRRLPEIARIERLRRLGVWWALDVVALPHPAARWLRALAARPTAILMAFARGDDGLEFLEGRVGRAWSATLRQESITNVILDDIDHPMHRQWLRPVVVDALRHWLNGNFPA